MGLLYKASNIAKAEKAEGKHFFKVVSGLASSADFGIDDLLFVWKCGGGSEEEFDEEFKSGVQSILLKVMEGINEAGFLGQKVDLSEMKKEMENLEKSSK